MKSFSILTHWDLDGAACAIFLNYVFRKKINQILACSYGKIDKNLQKLVDSGEENIIITDLNLSQEQFDFVKTNFRNYQIIDHHPGTKNLKSKGIIYSEKFCGAALVYKWLMDLKKELPPSFKELMLLTNDYDMYNLKMKKSVLLNELFWSIDKFCFYPFISRFVDDFEVPDSEWEKLKTKLNEKCKEVKTYEKIIIEDKMLIIFSQGLINEISLVYPKYDYYFIVAPNNGISIRTKEKSLLPWFESIQKHKLIDKAGGHERAGGIEMKSAKHEDQLLMAENLFEFMELQ